MLDSPITTTGELLPSKVTSLPVDRLLLDAENPRLLSGTAGDTPSQFELMRVLWTEMAVDELVLSIAANGYFVEERLFVVPQERGTQDAQYVVLEGNRRLAAVRILLDDDLRRDLRITKMPVINEQAKERLRQLPVSIYEDRSQLWTYLSFRHINEPMRWDSYSKARFVARVHDEYGVDLAEISGRIGDQHETVRRLYRGYKVLRQAQEQGVYDIDEVYTAQFYFSHWYTALAYSQFQQFLGIGPEDFDKDRPVPETHLEQLSELLTWIYGRRSGEDQIEPLVRKQDPDLNTLREVISDEASLQALRSGCSLSRSHEISVGEARRFRQSLEQAKEALELAGRALGGYSGEEDMFSLVLSIQRIARSLREEMEKRKDNLAEEE